MEAPELGGKPDKVKVAFLRLNLIDEINDYLDTLDPDKIKTLDHVFKELATHYLIKDNTNHQQFNFFQREQAEGESFNDFYTDLLKMAKYCNFDNQKDMLLKVLRNLLKTDLNITATTISLIIKNCDWLILFHVFQ
ncbi:hypothetical protein WDU94_012184 [Cyamophila willieti]